MTLETDKTQRPPTGVRGYSLSRVPTEGRFSITKLLIETYQPPGSKFTLSPNRQVGRPPEENRTPDNKPPK